MSWAGWPNGPATGKQTWLLRKLKLEVMNETLPDDHGLNEGQASAEIARLLNRKKEQDVIDGATTKVKPSQKPST
jgi:hypothetical protein